MTISHISRRHFVTAIALASTQSVTSFAQATDYPSRTITLVVPFPPGGQTDIVARTIGEQLSRRLKQTVIIENKPGANGSTASEAVSRAKPDGYTLVITGFGTHAVNQLVNPNVKYDARKNFTAINMLSRTSLALLVQPSLGVKSVSEFVSLSRSRTGGLNVALTGVGSSTHLAAELLKQTTGASINMVPYKGDAPAITDLLGGQVDALFVNLTSATPYVQSGKLAALAVTAPTRSTSLSTVPTMIEAGFPSIVLESWTGLAGPAGMPDDVVKKLNTEVNAILNMPEIKARLLGMGLLASPGTAVEARSWIASEVTKWEKVVKAGNIRAE